MKVLLLLLVSILLTGCHSIDAYPNTQSPLLSKSTVNSVYVHVRWHKSVDTLTDACTNDNRLMYGCAYFTTIENKNFCVIHAIEPKDFGDAAKMAILGHEFWHCLGARHLP